MEGYDLEVFDILKKYSAGVDGEIDKSLGTVDPQKLQDASKHLIKAGGKKIRPSLVLLSSEAVGGRMEGAYKDSGSCGVDPYFLLNP